MRKDISEINYESKLDLLTTQYAIKFVKDTFQKHLIEQIKLLRVTAPLFVLSKTGLNDNLSGKETPVSFHINSCDDDIEIIHSLAKWKRMALKKYGFKLYHGLYTDMNAIRKDEELDFCHSLYVDQWDWEMVISQNDLNLDELKLVVRKLYHAIYLLSKEVVEKYPALENDLPEDIIFISSRDLLKKYPNMSAKEREDEICRLHKAVFVYQIGWPLEDGNPHDLRAADYDDWNLNGDLFLYYPLYDMALEISSMGIRVNKESLVKQIKHKKEDYKLENEYCQAILHDELPFTIGGGIGQSRLCQLMLNKAHIGEVQVSVWPKNDIEELKKKNIYLL